MAPPFIKNIKRFPTDAKRTVELKPKAGIPTSDTFTTVVAVETAASTNVLIRAEILNGSSITFTDGGLTTERLHNNVVGRQDLEIGWQIQRNNDPPIAEFRMKFWSIDNDFQDDEYFRTRTLLIKEDPPSPFSAAALPAAADDD